MSEGNTSIAEVPYSHSTVYKKIKANFKLIFGQIFHSFYQLGRDLSKQFWCLLDGTKSSIF